MNHIEKLIQQLCPDGVEFKPLGEVVDYEQPGNYIVKSTNYQEQGIPVLTAGQSFILGYTKEDVGVYEANIENPVIIFDDFTTSFHWVDFRFKVKSSALKILTPKDERQALLRFIFYAMKCIKYKPQDHARQWISVYSHFPIPLPPLPVQEAIVEVLDKFSQLEAELEAELEARKQQYAYYREQLLNFEGRTDVEWRTLGEIGKVCMCKRILKSQTTPKGEIPFFKIGTFGKTADAYISKSLFNKYKRSYPFPNKGDVLISASGTIGRTVIYDGEPAYFQDSNIVWIDNDEKLVKNKFLYHYYKIVKWPTEGGTISRLYNNLLESIRVPLPPLSEQEHIVGILDRFDALVNDLVSGLPAELLARRKQYAYYRDRLLTFRPR